MAHDRKNDASDPIMASGCVLDLPWVSGRWTPAGKKALGVGCAVVSNAWLWWWEGGVALVAPPRFLLGRR